MGLVTLTSMETALRQVDKRNRNSVEAKTTVLPTLLLKKRMYLISTWVQSKRVPRLQRVARET